MKPVGAKSIPKSGGQEPTTGQSRNSSRPCSQCRASGYLLTEALVYIGLLFLVLGVGSAAMYRCIDNSVALRRNADDISRALHVGERWRADVRAATLGVQWDNSGGEPTLRLESDKSQVDYRFTDGALYRKIGAGPWAQVMDHVKSSSMEREARPNVIAWRWDLELEPKSKGSFKPGRLRPLFTFLAVPPRPSNP